jgi:predicted neutral ceramidase superfamily lipid hydrolase
MDLLKSLVLVLAFIFAFMLFQYVDTLFGIDILNPYVLAANSLLAFGSVFLTCLMYAIYRDEE